MLFKKPGAGSLVIRDMDGHVLNVIEDDDSHLFKF